MQNKTHKYIVEKLGVSKFIAYSPKYTFYGKGKTVNLAIKSLESQLDSFKKDQENIVKQGFRGNNTFENSESTINKNISLHQKNNYLYDLSLFAIKSLSIFVFFGIIIAIFSNNLEKSLNKKVDELSFTISNQATLLNQRIETEIQNLIKSDNLTFMEKLEREIYRGARPEHELDPERVNKIIESLDIIVERYRPYVKSISNLFND